MFRNVNEFLIIFYSMPFFVVVIRILCFDLMDRDCKYYIPYKVNGKYVYEGKFQIVFLNL